MLTQQIVQVIFTFIIPVSFVSLGSEVSVEEYLHLFSTRVNEERYLDILDLFLCLGKEIHEEKP